MVGATGGIPVDAVGATVTAAAVAATTASPATTAVSSAAAHSTEAVSFAAGRTASAVIARPGYHPASPRFDDDGRHRQSLSEDSKSVRHGSAYVGRTYGIHDARSGDVRVPHGASQVGYSHFGGIKRDVHL